MRVPIDSQPLMDQTFQNRGEGQLVRETMEYSDEGVLLDKAPYPGVYEYRHRQQYFWAESNGRLRLDIASRESSEVDR